MYALVCDGEGVPSESGEFFDPMDPATRKRMLLIVNPYATMVSDRLRHLVVYALGGRYEVEAIDTEAPGHAIEIGREAAYGGYDVVVVFGGDGTVNEAVNGMRGSPIPLTCMPGGLVNAYCRLLGIPGDIVDATEHMLALVECWEPRRVDLGIVNGRCFAFASGVGLHAGIVRRVDARPALKVRFGSLYMVWAAAAAVLQQFAAKLPVIAVEVNGISYTGNLVTVQNASPFTYLGARAVEVADGPELHSGTLNVCVLCRGRLADVLSIGYRAFSRRARVVGHSQVVELPEVREVTVRSSDGELLELQIDGVYIGDVTEAAYRVLPGELSVIS
jgi:diacylglycerol kinase family enzyme